LRRFVIGRDLAQRLQERWVIDFFGLSEVDARTRYPSLYQHVFDLVKPERDHNRRETRKRNWWLFGENAPKMRRALAGLGRFIATIETSKYKTFVFLDGDVMVDHKIYAIASDDAALLGILSSRAHITWALAAGGKLGVGNDPTWTNTTCFLPFAFPACTKAQTACIRALGESLDAHRKRRQAAHPDLTITGMYNVLAKLRSGEALTEKEKLIHEQGLISVLRQIHDELDAAVFDAYGWPPDLTDEQILEKLVALNAERAEEEERGQIRWLRPDFQNPSGARAATQETLVDAEPSSEDEPLAPTSAKPWPKKLAEQIVAVRDMVTRSGRAWSVEEVASTFLRSPRSDVEDILDSFAALGLVLSYPTTDGRRWRLARKAGM
jgi:hypothetical protein